VAALAFLCRLWPVLHGGGLRGLAGYDDGVYYSGADAIVSGRMPYRDFTLLHPPGLLFLLTPFAELGRLVGDADGWAVARVAMMLVGSLSAVLVVLVARRFGTVAALGGGLLYAVWAPAVNGEFSTLLECVPNALLLLALLVLGSPGRSRRVPYQLLAGAALGAGMSIKVWGIVPLAVVVGWQLLSAGWRRAAVVLAGSAAAAVVICGPVFALAPDRMFWFVIRDQLGRSGVATSLVSRAASFTQVHALLPTASAAQTWAALAVVGLLGLGCAVLAWSDRRARVFVVLLLANGAVLVGSPPYFQHYGAFLAAPVALTAGVGALRAAELVGRRDRSFRVALLCVLAIGLAVCVTPLALRSRMTTPFPGARLSAMLRSKRCVAADSPATLILSGVLTRDLQRHCGTRIDVSGGTYNVDSVRGPSGLEVPRVDNPLWQKDLLTYLLSAQAAIVARRHSDGLSKSSIAVLNRLPVLYRGSGITVYAVPHASSP
jgi:alpha-1,2-mannosyltransferase